MDLIIVESPTKARTLTRFLGKDFVIDSTMGHIRDLPKSKIGIDIEHDFSPEYVLVVKKKDVVKNLKSEASRASKVYLATDPDREGEAIAYHVFEVLHSTNKQGLAKKEKPDGKYVRIVFHEITEQAVKEAIAHPREINIPLVDAQQARRVLDRLVGYKLSPLLWKKIRRGLSAGRVQSVTVRLVVEREREIESFKPLEYWEIGAQVKTQNAKGKNSVEFLVKLIKINDKKAEVGNSEVAKKIVSDLEKATYKVSGVEKKEVIKRPHPPFTTSTMTQAASRLYYWSAKKTMSIAQKLYEEGLITYHRTDSTNLSAQAINVGREYIAANIGQNYLPASPRIYKTKSKVAQEAHEAIRPTEVRTRGVESQVTSLGGDAQKLYNLIWKRFVACQMADGIYDETIINVEACISHTYLLQARGQTMRFDGWARVYGQKLDDLGAVQLPEVLENEPLQLIKVTSEQKFTEPPVPYTEASLVKTLEKLGIGRPSTYAPTLSTIQDRQYVEKNEGKFSPTSLGIAVNDFLLGYFPDIVDYNFTAQMEDELDGIANGKREWVPLIRDFWKPFSKKLEKVEETAARVKVETETTGEKCPKCKVGDQVIRVGRFGKFLSCSRFPDCDWKDAYVQKLEIKCPNCLKGDVIVKKTKRGKKFFGCSRYPKCKWASWKKPEKSLSALDDHASQAKV